MLTPSQVYKILASYAVTQNYNQTAREVDFKVTVKTVRECVLKNKDNKEFIKLQLEAKEEFIDTAKKIVNKGSRLLIRKLDRALEDEFELDTLIDEILKTDKKEISQEDKRRLICKVGQMQLQDIKSIVMVVGTIFDKMTILNNDSPTDDDSHGIIEITKPNTLITPDNDEFEGIIVDEK